VIYVIPFAVRMKFVVIPLFSPNCYCVYFALNTYSLTKLTIAKLSIFFKGDCLITVPWVSILGCLFVDLHGIFPALLHVFFGGRGYVSLSV
jgi:hypothetical protein